MTADLPESAFHVTGTDHISIIGSNIEDTITFYRDVLGMPLVLKQPNLDAPNITHLFFDTGDGRMLTFFVKEGRESNTGRLRTPIGGVHHIAFRYEPERLEEIRAGLEEHGHHYNEFDRGIFHSLYTTDHNGLVIELATDKFEIPDDRRGEVLALAQQKRLQAGASFAKAEHLEAALEELALPVERKSLPDVQSGAGGLD
ncbi:lactoylglutathione lyase-like protein / aromatic compounds dioxygenase [Haloferax mediterranei ATCC 33500]|uniref:Lactoylglutathione lyase-like protein / aromatic compounds dioxygenase n=1 Tax=Haloferax mediterranei (strain ATCC 33500 / DSM 1411 / JCM 8866 / NBRC 14739 / NCIMB 2177 / R-4) TaxID=523841 RepID=M0IK25_HALMT|nr:lactoylglutathione lyase-like protein / aromatic compounds dioxygenase [Haloferax mediterranei ATCC 33500]